jgi:hypothetical protein
MYKSNIFFEHYKKRDGAIYKDFLNHKERIKMLNEFIMNSFKIKCQILESDKLYKQYSSLVKANERSIRFFCKLKKFCNKNKHIKEV